MEYISTEIYPEIKQIRILPISDKEFANKAEVDSLFAGTLTTESHLASYDGIYRYRNHTNL